MFIQREWYLTTEKDYVRLEGKVKKSALYRDIGTNFERGRKGSVELPK